MASSGGWPRIVIWIRQQRTTPERLAGERINCLRHALLGSFASTPATRGGQPGTTWGQRSFLRCGSIIPPMPDDARWLSDNWRWASAWIVPATTCRRSLFIPDWLKKPVSREGRGCAQTTATQLRPRVAGQLLDAKMALVANMPALQASQRHPSYRGSARTLRPSRCGNVCAARPVGIVPPISTSPPGKYRSPALYFDAVENPLQRPQVRNVVEARRSRPVLCAGRVPYRPGAARRARHHHPRPFRPCAGRPSAPCWRRRRRSPSCRRGWARRRAGSFQEMRYGETDCAWAA